MKATALITAAALACGTAAYAQQDKSARGTEGTRTEQQDHGTAGQKLRSGLHRLGEKTRHALHRAGDAVHRTAKREDRNDTRAMGAAGSADDRDAARQRRMDDAYANWKDRQARNR